MILTNLEWTFASNDTPCGNGQISIAGITTYRMLQTNMNAPLSKRFDLTSTRENQQHVVERSGQCSSHARAILQSGPIDMATLIRS